MLDIRTPISHGDKWHCTGCNTWNESRITRCSFCSKPKPIQDSSVDVPSQDEGRVTQSLHTAIENMSYGQKVKTWRWLEDNII